MDTPKKRNLSDVEPDSSPDTSVISQPKKVNSDMMTPEGQVSQAENLGTAINRIEAKLNELLSLKTTMGNLQSGLTDLSSSVDSVLQKVNDIEKEYRAVSLMAEQCKHENTLLRRKLQFLEERQIKAEAYSRRDNLIFEGVRQSEGEDLEKTIKEIIRVNMQCPQVANMKFVRIHRLPGPSRPQRVIVKFHYFQDRQVVWAKRFKLKGQQIWVSEDFPVEVRNRRQVLYPIFKAAKSLPDTKAVLSVDKLFVNNEPYTVDNLHQLPPSLKLQQTSLVTKDDTVFFYSRSSPLSNFFPAPIAVDGVQYSCSEQYYQAKKAEEHKDYEAMDRIMMASDPADMFRVASKIKTSDRWKTGTRKLVMEKANIAKFTQNKHLADVLLSTGEMDIVEASPTDTFWGAGVSLKKICATPKDQWRGQNELGTLLMKIRQTMAGK